MGCWRFIKSCLMCCCCCKKSQTESFLLKTRKDSTPESQYYTVRRISSFGRAVSKDEDDGFSGTQFQTALPSASWTTKSVAIQPVNKYDEDVVFPVTKQSKRWKKALNNVKKRDSIITKTGDDDHGTVSSNPKKSGWSKAFSYTSRHNSPDTPPPITISSPDLVNGKPSAASSVENWNIGSAGSLKPHEGPWLKSQSMQDVNSISVDSDTAARCYGLDTSLYHSSMPASKSTEALNKAWRSLETLGDADRMQELPTGTVHFTTCYDMHNKTLSVNVERLSGLAGKGEHCTPYSTQLKLTLLPGGKHVRTGNALAASANPFADEDFIFAIRDLAGRILRLSVFEVNRPGKYDAIGHALFYLEDVLSPLPKPHEMKLFKQATPDVNPGTLQVSLMFNAETKFLTLTVVQARKLAVKLGKFKTYVKAATYVSGKKVKSKQSPVVLCSHDAFYNYIMKFKFDSSDLSDSFLVISVKVRDMLRYDKTLGQLILGPHFFAEGGQKLTPWGKAILKNESVSHSFRMYL